MLDYLYGLHMAEPLKWPIRFIQDSFEEQWVLFRQSLEDTLQEALYAMKQNSPNIDALKFFLNSPQAGGGTWLQPYLYDWDISQHDHAFQRLKIRRIEEDCRFQFWEAIWPLGKNSKDNRNKDKDQARAGGDGGAQNNWNSPGNWQDAEKPAREKEPP